MEPKILFSGIDSTSIDLVSEYYYQQAAHILTVKLRLTTNRVARLEVIKQGISYLEMIPKGAKSYGDACYDIAAPLYQETLKETKSALTALERVKYYLQESCKLHHQDCEKLYNVALKMISPVEGENMALDEFDWVSTENEYFVTKRGERLCHAISELLTEVNQVLTPSDPKKTWVGFFSQKVWDKGAENKKLQFRDSLTKVIAADPLLKKEGPLNSQEMRELSLKYLTIIVQAKKMFSTPQDETIFKALSKTEQRIVNIADEYTRGYLEIVREETNLLVSLPLKTMAM